MAMQTLVITSIFLFSSILIHAQNYVLQNGHAEVHGQAPVSSYTGVSDALEGTLNTTSGNVDFKLKLQTLKTGNHKRDRDMYKTLDVDVHPYAEFNGRITSKFNPQNKEKQKVTVKGNFSIHGVSKEIEVNGTLEPTDEGLMLTASFPINITQYGMKRPHILAYKVDDKHTIQVNGLLHQEISVKK